MITISGRGLTVFGKYVQNIIINDDFVIPLISTGTGGSVGTLKMQVSTTINMTINGNGHFYDDVGGTIGENQNRDITSGDVRTFYIKVSSGSCFITVTTGKLYLTKITDWSSGTNAPCIYELNLIDLPRGLIEFQISPGTGAVGVTLNNTITGNISDLPSGITALSIRGANTVYGDIVDLSPITVSILISGYNTITGDISNISSSVTRFDITGSNSLYGDIADLKEGLLYFLNGNFGSQPYITGDIAYLPSTLQIFWLRGSNNSITGIINNFPTGITSIWIETANNSINTYTAGRDWSNNMSLFYIKSNSAGTGLTSTEIDNLIIDLDSGNSWLYPQSINITGSYYSTRTSASDAAVASLLSKGLSAVVTNSV